MVPTAISQRPSNQSRGQLSSQPVKPARQADRPGRRPRNNISTDDDATSKF